MARTHLLDLPDQLLALVLSFTRSPSALGRATSCCRRLRRLVVSDGGAAAWRLLCPGRRLQWEDAAPIAREVRPPSGDKLRALALDYDSAVFAGTEGELYIVQPSSAAGAADTVLRAAESCAQARCGEVALAVHRAADGRRGAIAVAPRPAGYSRATKVRCSSRGGQNMRSLRVVGALTALAVGERMFATARRGSGVVHLWQADSGAFAGQVAAHAEGSTILFLAFRGGLLLSASTDSTVALHGTREGAEQEQQEEEGAAAGAAAAGAAAAGAAEEGAGGVAAGGAAEGATGRARSEVSGPSAAAAEPAAAEPAAAALGATAAAPCGDPAAVAEPPRQPAAPSEPAGGLGIGTDAPEFMEAVLGYVTEQVLLRAGQVAAAGGSGRVEPQVWRLSARPSPPHPPTHPPPHTHPHPIPHPAAPLLTRPAHPRSTSARRSSKAAVRWRRRRRAAARRRRTRAETWEATAATSRRGRRDSCRGRWHGRRGTAARPRAPSSEADGS